MSIVSKIKQRMNPTKLKVAGIAALITLTAGLGYATSAVSSAQTVSDCTVNSIIKCGEQTPSSFISAAKSNGSHHDLQAVYSNFGLVSSDYSKFVSSARMGTAYMNGTIVVDGQTVATNAWSIGRTHFSYATPYHIPGSNQTYYSSPDKRVLLSNIPVMVMFNSKGVMQFAVMTACGNPATGNKVTPTYACNELNQTHISGNTYKFTTSASAGNNAKIVKVVYDFGDGSATVTQSNPNTAVSHTFTKSSTVTVKVYVSLPGNQTIVVQSSLCSKHITVTPPPPVQGTLTCNNLSLTPGTVASNGDQTFSLEAQASATTNAGITSYVFNFGDNSSKTVATSSTSTSITHTYVPGTYTATVTVNGSTNGKNISAPATASCEVTITVKKPPTPPAQGSLTCDNLTLTPGTADNSGNVPYTLRATASTSASNATISSYTFTLGDSSANTTVPTSSTTATTKHTYAPGNWTASVTVNGTVNGKAVTQTSSSCSGEVKVGQPPVTPVFACDQLTLSPVGQADANGNVAYTLSATASASNATITSYNFNFGDSSQDQMIATTDTSASANHTYAPGTHTAQVTVMVTLADGTTKQVTADSCKAQITVAAPTCTAPSGQTFPAGSAQCTPTPPSTPTPTALPNTGPGDAVGLFSGVSMSGAGIHRILSNRRARRAAARE